eukprot:Gb_20292 [translate_table: standard]
MGRSRSQYKSSKLSDSDDDMLSSSSTRDAFELAPTQGVNKVQGEDDMLEMYLDALYEKRSSTRENALRGLIKAFKSNVQIEFAEDKSETLLRQYIGSVKRASASEAALAAHALGLLAITLGAGKMSHRVMQESFSPLSCLAKFGSDADNRISAMESLAIVTFVGANDLVETEKTMDILWQVSQHKGNAHAEQVLGTKRPSPPVRAAAISAWAFLLTTVPRQCIERHYLEEKLSLLSSLLDMDDQAIRKAVGEAIALLFEISSLMNLHEDEFNNFSSDGVDKENTHYPTQLPSMNVLQAKVTEQMKALSIEAGGKRTSRKDLNFQRSSFRDFLASVKNSVRPEIVIKLQYGDAKKISTWLKIIQLNMLRHFLGGGFQKHMQANLLLHGIFNFTPRQEKKQALSVKEKRMYMSTNSMVSKERTHQLNKKRSLAQAANYGHYGVDVDEDD